MNPNDLSGNTKQDILSSHPENLFDQNKQADLFSDPETSDYNEEEDGDDMEAEFKQLTSKEHQSTMAANKANTTAYTSPIKRPHHLSLKISSLFLNCNQEENLLRCSFCTQNRSQFFCENCIKNGDFTSSKQTEVIKERFAEKKLKFIKLNKNIENINQNLQNKLSPKIKLNRLNHELTRCQENKGILQENLTINRKEINNLNKDYKEIDKKLLSNRKKNQSLNKMLVSLRNDVECKEQQVAERKLKLNLINERIRQASKEKIFQLTNYIFPITTYNSDENPETGLVYSCESSPLLTISGESGSSCERDSDDNEKMVIVEPWLPSNGNYLAYNVWVAQHRDLVASSGGLTENSIRTVANRISSALSYTTQLLSVIGFYLDEKFPRKLHFKEFYTNTDQNGRKIYLTDEKFAHKVAKLNANILYFCLQQGVDIRLLEPKRTLKNLQLLTDINPIPFDKAKAYTFSQEAERLVEYYLGHDLALAIDEDEFDYNPKEDYERAEDDLNEFEWESVPEMPYSINNDTLMYSNQNASTNIFSSVVNIFRAATRR